MASVAPGPTQRPHRIGARTPHSVLFAMITEHTESSGERRGNPRGFGGQRPRFQEVSLPPAADEGETAALHPTKRQ